MGVELALVEIVKVSVNAPTIVGSNSSVRVVFSPIVRELSIVSALRIEKPFPLSAKATESMVRGANPTLVSTKSRVLKVPPTPSAETGKTGIASPARRSFPAKVTPNSGNSSSGGMTNSLIPVELVGWLNRAW